MFSIGKINEVVNPGAADEFPVTNQQLERLIMPQVKLVSCVTHLSEHSFQVEIDRQSLTVH